MGDDPGDQAYQHDEGTEGRQPTAKRIRHLELEVETVEELAAAAVAGLDRLAGLRVEAFADKAAPPGLGVTPAHAQRSLAGIRQTDHPTAGVRGIGLQVALGQA
ncbi:hypothetical protein D3C76_1457540 [compost metagenome]